MTKFWVTEGFVARAALVTVNVYVVEADGVR